jgi:uncharacterized protein
MTLSAAVTAALLMGLLGSLHCATMCGPLVAMGCARGSRLHGAIGYFTGRLVAYATVGAVMGHLGRHALCVLPVSAAQVAAVALTALPAGYRGITLLRRGQSGPALVQLRKARPGQALAWLASLLPRRGLGLGLVTGVLPCGLLLEAGALAGATASPAMGALVMVTLAMATLPGLVVPLAGGQLVRRFTAGLSPRIHGLLWCALAAWLLARPALTEAHCRLAQGH